MSPIGRILATLAILVSVGLLIGAITSDGALGHFCCSVILVVVVATLAILVVMMIGSIWAKDDEGGASHDRP